MLRRVIRCATIMAMAVILVSCSTIPTSGPVFRSEAVVEVGHQSYLRAPGPRPDASPIQIVQGFLNAQPGALTTKSPTGDFSVAQSFLTRQARQAWEPTVNVVVYTGELPLTANETYPEDDTTTVHGSATVAAAVDRHGVYSQSLPGRTTDVAFDLVRDEDGQWRIGSAPSGLLITDTNFERVYRETPLYFPTPDRKHLVPDERWFPTRNWQTYAVRETLVGPAPWLSASVVTVAPTGTTLAIEAVSLEGTGPVRIQLNDVVAQAEPQDRALLVHQLEAVLSPGVPRSVRLLAGTEELRVAGESLPAAPTVAAPGGTAMVVADDRVTRLSGAQSDPVPGLAPLTGLDPTALAFHSPSAESVVVVRDGRHRIVAAPRPETALTVLFEGDGVLAPSVDRFAHVWTGTQTQDGALAVLRAGAVTRVAAPWLADRTIQSIRVSPDAARIAIASTGSGGARVDVAGIIRDQDSVPTRLSEPFTIGDSLVGAGQVTWAGPTLVGVLGRTGLDDQDRVYLVDVGGPTSATSIIDATVALCAAGTTSSLLLSTSDLSLWVYGSGAMWVRLGGGMRLPSYAG